MTDDEARGRPTFSLGCGALEVSTVEPEAAGAGWRVLGVLLALVLAFACAVMIVAMIDIGGTPTCHDISSGNAAVPADGQCFSGSSLQKTISLVLGWPSGVIAGGTAVLALAFAITGRSGRRMLLATALAMVLGALTFLIGSI
jgi:hypothetical protein